MSKHLASKKPELRQDKRGVVRPVSIENSMANLTDELQRQGMSRGLVVVWQMQNVVWGRLQEGRISLAGEAPLEPVYWQEIRVFNEDAELHLVRCGDRLVGRFRADEGEDVIKYIDAFSLLWGMRDDDNETPSGYMRLTDKNRGLSMVLPDDGGVPAVQYGLVTRNYVGVAHKENAQAGYIDCRFVRIDDADMEGVKSYADSYRSV